MSGAIARLRSRPDFRDHPWRAVSRRCIWRLRWLFNQRPWPLQLPTGSELLVTRSGSGALIYYLGFSEPETASFVMGFLQPGMMFWDIGAHMGEYSLLAAKQVGDSGHVDAFEPRPDVFALLGQNVSVNRLTNVTLYDRAVAADAGTAELSLTREPSLSALEPPGAATGTLPTVAVKTMSLDHFHRSCGRTPHLIKVDVEGAEQLVLAGSPNLLQLPAAESPVWVMEYAPENCRKFGYSAKDLLTVFAMAGYETFWLAANVLLPTNAPPPWESSGNFVATKRTEGLLKPAMGTFHAGN